MIEGLDRVVTTKEAEAGRELLAALSHLRSIARHYAVGSPAYRRAHLRLTGCEQAYDALPVADRQIRDAMDDALANAGWERVA